MPVYSYDMDLVSPSPSGKRQRRCPALGGFIAPADCGSNRGTRISCPGDCPHFPFGPAGYDQFLQVSSRFNNKLLGWLEKNLEPSVIADLLQSFGMNPDTSGVEAEHAGASVTHLGFKLALAKPGSENDWKEASNDERILFEATKNAYVTIVEIQSTDKQGRIMAVDLFSPDASPFLIFDRAASKTVARFSKLAALLVPLPGFVSLTGSLCSIPEMIWPAYEEELREWYGEEAKALPGLTWREFFWKNYAECLDLIDDLFVEIRDQMLNRIDLHRCEAAFKLNSTPQAVLDELAGKPDFVPLSEDEIPVGGSEKPIAALRWVRLGESKKIEESMPGVFQTSGDTVGGLAELFIFKNQIVLETLSRQKYDFARQMLDRYLGEKISLETEKITDLAKQMKEKWDEEADGETEEESLNEEPEPGGKSEIPIEQQRQLLRNFHEAHYRKFLDDKIPALQGHTPREASANPKLRPLLIALMKSHINSIEQRNRDENLDLSLNPILDELHLPELKDP